MQSESELTRDPKNHDEAMADDSSGWLQAENDELENHQKNGSFELMDRSTFEREAPNRRLVKLVWVYFFGCGNLFHYGLNTHKQSVRRSRTHA